MFRAPALSAAVLMLVLLAACAPPLPPPVPDAKEARTVRLQPAPMPFVHYGPAPTAYGVSGSAVAPKMPPGTGTYPVSNSPVRGSITTGLHEAF